MLIFAVSIHGGQIWLLATTEKNAKIDKPQTMRCEARGGEQVFRFLVAAAAPVQARVLPPFYLYIRIDKE